MLPTAVIELSNEDFKETDCENMIEKSLFQQTSFDDEVLVERHLQTIEWRKFRANLMIKVEGESFDGKLAKDQIGGARKPFFFERFSNRKTSKERGSVNRSIEEYLDTRRREPVITRVKNYHAVYSILSKRCDSTDNESTALRPDFRIRKSSKGLHHTFFQSYRRNAVI